MTSSNELVAYVTRDKKFQIDLYDSDAAPGNRHWRIVLEKGVLQIVMLDEHEKRGALRVERNGTNFDVIRGDWPA